MLELSDEVLFRQDLDPRCVQQAKQEKCRIARDVLIFPLFFKGIQILVFC
jgi:hypothetical protein